MHLCTSTWFFMLRGLRRNARTFYFFAVYLVLYVAGFGCATLGQLVAVYFSSLCCGVWVRNARTSYFFAAYFSSLCCGVRGATLGRLTSLPSTLVLYVAGFEAQRSGSALVHVYLVLYVAGFEAQRSGSALVHVYFSSLCCGVWVRNARAVHLCTSTWFFMLRGLRRNARAVHLCTST